MRWEYQVVEMVLKAGGQPDLDEEGEQGWEAVSVLPASSGSKRVLVFMKRPVKGSGDDPAKRAKGYAVR